MILELLDNKVDLLSVDKSLLTICNRCLYGLFILAGVSCELDGLLAGVFCELDGLLAGVFCELVQFGLYVPTVPF